MHALACFIRRAFLVKTIFMLVAVDTHMLCACSTLTAAISLAQSVCVARGSPLFDALFDPIFQRKAPVWAKTALDGSSAVFCGPRVERNKVLCGGACIALCATGANALRRARLPMVLLCALGSMELLQMSYNSYSKTYWYKLLQYDRRGPQLPVDTLILLDKTIVAKPAYKAWALYFW
jgi:hypothetical protein